MSVERERRGDGRREARPEPVPARLVIPPGQLYAELRRAILLVLCIMLAWRFAAVIADLLLFFLLAFILAAVLNPVVTRLEQWRVPRLLSAIVLVFLLIAAVGLLLWLGLPPILRAVWGFIRQFEVGQLQLTARYETFRGQFPDLAAVLPPPEVLFQSLTPRVAGLVERFAGYAWSLVGGLLSLLVLFVLVIYTVGRPDPLVAGFLSVVPEAHRERAGRALRLSMEQVGNWARGVLIVGALVGTASGFGLHYLGLPYAPLFGLIAVLGEATPSLGPILASIPPILLALTIDPMLALWVALLFLVIQQVEANLLSPFIFGQGLQVHPVTIIFVVLAMFSIFGPLGAILAVPVTGILKVCWEEFYLQPRHEDVEQLEEEAEEIVTADVE